jgi:type IV secretory pathway VirB2 component (pilin)
MKKIMGTSCAADAKAALKTGFYKTAAFFGTSAGKRVVMVGMYALVAGVSVFAQDTGFTSLNTTLNSRVSNILSVIFSPWMKGVACIALVAECIGMLTAGRQEPGMFKKFIPWIVGTVLFLAAGSITTAFMGNLETPTFTTTS